MGPEHLQSASAVRAAVVRNALPPAEFRRQLCRVPMRDRDAWVDVAFGLDDVIADGPELPRGCTPYLPCAVDPVLRAVDQAQIGAADVVVDIGSGMGRAALLIHLLTGAQVVGIEVQSALATASRRCAQELNVTRFSVLLGDAELHVGRIEAATVFFLYCPFSGSRLHRVLDGIEPLATTRPLRICAVDLQVPHKRWLAPSPHTDPDLVVCRSTPVADRHPADTQDLPGRGVS